MIDTGAVRNKVLELALRGSLSEQMASDGTADDLYEKVQKEKDALVKEGKISRNKVIPIKEEEKPYAIPDNWKWIRWGDLSEAIQYGYNAPAKTEGRIKMVRISDIQDNQVSWDTVPYCDIDEESIEAYLLHENDILFARTGGTVGKSYIVNNIPEKAVFAGYLIRTSYSSSLNSKYMKYFMESKLYWKQLQNGTIATAQPNCNGKTLAKMMVPLPPLAEQIRIVEKVELIFSVLETIDDMQERYANDCEILKSKLIDAGIRGKLTEQLPEDGNVNELLHSICEKKKELEIAGRIKKSRPIPELTGEDIPFAVPSTWKWERWGNVVNIVSAKRVYQADWRKEGIPFYRAREVAKLAENGFVDNDLFISQELYEEFSKSGVPQPGDLMVTAVGTLGKTYVVKEDDVFYYKDASVICFENYGGLIPKYLKCVMDSEMMKSQIVSNSGGTTVDTLTMVRMVKYVIPIPPLEEQKRIVDRIEELLQYCQ